MVAERSRMKLADRPAHSSGRNGGDRRVLECPGSGVLQMMPTATDGTGSASMSDKALAARAFLHGRSFQRRPMLRVSRRRVIWWQINTTILLFCNKTAIRPETSGEALERARQRLGRSDACSHKWRRRRL